jgi:RimJ/RimL family protein N-acetyltransferase
MKGPFQLQESPLAMSAEGIHLRRLGPKDVGLLVDASGDTEIVRWTFIPPDLDDASALSLIDRWQTRMSEGRLRQYVISSHQSMPPVGLVSLALQDPTDAWLADVAYWLLPAGRLQGLATRAVKLVLNWAFNHSELRRAALYTMEGNRASEQVAIRCGFRDTGTTLRKRGDQELLLRRWFLPCHQRQGLFDL